MGAVARARDAPPRRPGSTGSSAPTTTARSCAAIPPGHSTPGRRSPRSRPDTERIRLGTMVSPVTFRPASVLAKSGRQPSTTSRTGASSSGSAPAGSRPSTRPTASRSGRRASGSTSSTASSPRSHASGRTRPTSGRSRVQQPRPPIIVGGRAKPRTVRAAVRFADEYNTVFPSVDEARERHRVLDEAAHDGRSRTASVLDDDRLPRRAGTRPSSTTASPAIAKSSRRSLPPISGTVDQVVEQLRAYEEAGVERAMLQHLVHEDVDMVTVLGDVAAGLR